MKRIGVIGIVIENKTVVIELQRLLSEFGDIIIGRMGIPRENVSAISLIVEGTTERISALTGKLGKMDLTVKSAITSYEVKE